MSMELDEAILYHAVEVEMLKQHKKVNEIFLGTEGYKKALQEHTQLAEWLTELSERRKLPEIIRCKDCLMHGVCRFERGLGLDGYCSQAERRTDD